MVEVTGAAVGQVNGLAVLSWATLRSAGPSRITCRTYQGRAGVINIEREARLSGRTHDKGILILSGFLGGRFAQDKPLSLSASIAFEQSYEGVDGDSASSTELYALALQPGRAAHPAGDRGHRLGEPTRRGPGHRRGHGQDRGLLRRLPGDAGRADRRPGGDLARDQRAHLMLRDDVVDAVAQGLFHIWPVRTVDEGIELLTGVPAGERDADGAYPPDSVNGRVDRQLRELAEKLEAFGKKPRGPTAEVAIGKCGENQQDDGSDKPLRPAARRTGSARGSAGAGRRRMANGK